MRTRSHGLDDTDDEEPTLPLGDTTSDPMQTSGAMKHTSVHPMAMRKRVSAQAAEASGPERASKSPPKDKMFHFPEIHRPRICGYCGRTVNNNWTHHWNTKHGIKAK